MSIHFFQKYKYFSQIQKMQKTAFLSDFLTPADTFLNFYKKYAKNPYFYSLRVNFKLSSVSKTKKKVLVHIFEPKP